jgi:hypothetical protein
MSESAGVEALPVGTRSLLVGRPDLNIDIFYV